MVKETRLTTRPDNQRRGSTLVEAALVTIPFFTLILGIIACGYLVFTYDSLAFGAQQGARWASVRGSTSGTPATTASVQAFVNGQVPGLVPASLSVQTTWSPDNKPGSTVTVQVSYTAAPLSTLSLPNTLTIRSSSSTTVSR
jgi:Flp pilus assembly protein TadG